MPRRFTPERVDELINALEALHAEALRDEQSMAGELELVARAHRPSARNLVHYLALRHHDVRQLQVELTRMGFSSLGRSEAHVLAAIESVLAPLYRIAGRTPAPRPALPVDFDSGPALLAGHASELFGPSRGTRSTRLLVTLPSEAAQQPALARELLAAGMDLARINCSHDDAAAWERMLAHLAAARAELGRPCRVLFDLGGPKLRTAEFAPGPRVIHVSPLRDARGLLVRPARVLLWPAGAPQPASHDCDALLPLAGSGFRRLNVDSVLHLRDTRDKARRLRLVAARGSGWMAECHGSAWIEEGCELATDERPAARCKVQGLKPVESSLELQQGARLWLVPAGAPHELDGVPCVGCTLPEVLGDLRAGERILFDDGKLGGVIRSVAPHGVEVEIVSARPGGSTLRADKGINLPDSRLSIAGLTPQDRSDLDFVASRADLIGLSFVRSADDVVELERELDHRGAASAGILVKVETRQAFDYLPSILLAGMRSPPLGVMVARGDLAVELGFERLAEVQEEILWLCEAAHVPVVWATQVLDSLTRKGQPSRAEVTDAAMAGRAECVMLNKGPHAALALRFLDDVLGRMQQHQTKKRALLRRLSVSDVERLRGGNGHTPAPVHGALGVSR